MYYKFCGANYLAEKLLIKPFLQTPVSSLMAYISNSLIP